MNAFSQNTNRRLGMINVVVIVFGFLISSGTHFCEECLQEVETIEVELLLVHRDDQPAENDCNESEINFDSSFGRLPVRFLPKKIATTALNAIGERGKMNGIGTYLQV